MHKYPGTGVCGGEKGPADNQGWLITVHLPRGWAICSLRGCSPMLTAVFHQTLIWGLTYLDIWERLSFDRNPMPAQRLRLAVGCGQADTLGLYHSSTLYQRCGTSEALFTPQPVSSSVNSEWLIRAATVTLPFSQLHRSL